MPKGFLGNDIRERVGDRMLGLAPARGLGVSLGHGVRPRGRCPRGLPADRRATALRRRPRRLARACRRALPAGGSDGRGAQQAAEPGLVEGQRVESGVAGFPVAGGSIGSRVVVVGLSAQSKNGIREITGITFGAGHSQGTPGRWRLLIRVLATDHWISAPQPRVVVCVWLAFDTAARGTRVNCAAGNPNALRPPLLYAIALPRVGPPVE
jgi:hypothetical protein